MSTKISALPAASAPNVTDATVVPLVDATTTTVKLTIAQLRTQLMTVTLTSSISAAATPILSAASGGLNESFLKFANTGNTDTRFGVESSVGAQLFTGAAAYATVLGTLAAKSLQFATNNTIQLSIASSGAATFTSSVTIASGGLAVTGASSFTGLVTIPSAVTSAAGTGTDIVLGATTQTTVGAAGGASAIPGFPLGYLVFYKGATKCAIPYYIG